MICRCCGRYMDKEEDLCSYCGLLQVKAGSLEGEQSAQELAGKYRAFILGSINDISVEFPMFDKVKRFICNGKDCYRKIVWCKEELPPFSGEDCHFKELIVQMNIMNKERTIVVENTIIKKDQPWKMGIGIDESLRLCCYFGNEEFLICKGPYDLQI